MDGDRDGDKNEEEEESERTEKEVGRQRQRVTDKSEVQGPRGEDKRLTGGRERALESPRARSF